jgi:hypothetical protein
VVEHGFVEYAVAEFPGNNFSGAIAPALADLTDRGLIRILDLTFVQKAADGTVRTIELGALSEDEAQPFLDLDGEVSGLLSEQDLEIVGENLAPDSSSAVLVWENTWAAGLGAAVAGSEGRIAARGTISREAVAAAMAAATDGE